MEKKTILLGVTGGIAAFKSAQLTSNLLKKNYDVEVIMTKNATEFVTPLTFESLISHKVAVDTFEPVSTYDIHHISLAKKADLVVICPATANVIAKLANGLADDMLSTTVLATKAPILLCPAMNTNMYENPITQNNLQKCKDYGMTIVEPAEGLLACKDIGKGKLADLSLIEDAIDSALNPKQDLDGIHIVVSAGPTVEALDPVRFITNHSSGKMGYAIASAAQKRGAKVSLVSGPTNLEVPSGVQLYKIQSALELLDTMSKLQKDADITIMSAAVGDYRANHIEDHKIKKAGDTLTVEFIKNPDILKHLSTIATSSQVLCGFAMETQNVIEQAQAKLISKNVDMIVANDLNEAGAGFQTDTNKVSLIETDKVTNLDLMSKLEVGNTLLTHLLEKWKDKN